MYDDEEIENIEFFTKRLMSIIELYKSNKENHILYELINETVSIIKSNLK